MTDNIRSTSSLVINQHSDRTPYIIPIFGPNSQFITKCKHLMLLAGVVNIFLDALFMYLPSARGPTCFSIDFHLKIFLTVARTLTDLLHLMYMILKFRIACEGKGAKVFGTRNLITDPWLIATTYLKSKFVIDLLAILPLPQIFLWSNYISDDLRVFDVCAAIYIQFTPRMLAMIPLDRKIIKAAAGIAMNTAWSGAIYNLFVFGMCGHYAGAAYYIDYMLKLEKCLIVDTQKDMNSSIHAKLDCSQAHKDCVAQNKHFENAIHSDAFEKQIGSRSFVQKFMYCFVWGVRSLSSLGQVFDTSFDIWETSFSCLVMIIGLILLADLIAQMQTSVQSMGARREKQRIKQRRLDEWTHYHELPHDLKGRVRDSVQSEWQGTIAIHDECILNSLPSDLRHDIRNHLYKERVRNIPPFTRMDEQLLDFICGHLTTLMGTEGTYIVLQGDPVEQMVFIFSGCLQLSHHSGCRSNSRNLEGGDFFGEELLTWASQPNASIPPSAYTVKCLSTVEAFSFPADDVRLLSVFNYSHSFQHALRVHHA